MQKDETLPNHIPTTKPKGNHPHPINPSVTEQQLKYQGYGEERSQDNQSVLYVLLVER